MPATQEAQPQFMRLLDNGRAGGALQTAIAHYHNKQGVHVDLVAAVHIGEQSYYRGLNKTFTAYDAVLYEMVKPQDAGLPAPGAKSDNPINQLQHFLKDSLNLDFQLDDIDYSRPNFVHADLTKEEFEKLQKDRGESFQSLLLKQFLRALTEPPSGDEVDSDKMVGDLIGALTRPDAERQIKLFLARQMGDMEKKAADFGLGDTVILSDRNKKALEVLQKTIAGGKKKIAVFYGAAHMPGISDKLRDMGFTLDSTDWETAWDLTIRTNEPSAVEKLLNSLFGADTAAQN
jgi:hypothetical protein